MRRWWTCFLVLALVAGCGGQRSRGLPFYQRGRNLVLQKEYDEGRKAFEVCLQRQPDYAPAHLELGMLCEEQFHDLWGAAYHYREFLRLDPEHSQRPVVERWLERVDEALFREWAAAHPQGAVTKDMADLQAERDDLSRRLTNAATLFRQMEADNQSLREQLAKAEEARLAAVEDTVAVAANQETAPTAPVAPPPAPTPTVTTPALPKPPPATAVKPAPTVRLHTVEDGDTLAAISRQYYGTIRYWPQLQECNRETLRGGTRLIIGQQLRIPSLEEVKKMPTIKEGGKE